MNKKLIKKINHNLFVEKEEEWRVCADDKTPVIANSAYSKQDGGYIGDVKAANIYINKFGIETFEKTRPDNSVCSIGFNPKAKKWYGWSHRAIFGFGVGYITKEGECQTTSGWTDEYLKDNPEELDNIIPVGFICDDINDCKRVAIAFAESVS